MKSKLSDICYIAKGKVSVSELTLHNYVSTENLQPNKGGLVEAASLPSIAQVQSYEIGDVLVSNIRPYFKKIWHAQNNGGCSNDVLVFRTKSCVDSTFLYYVLADDAFFTYSNATSKGTKMPRGDKTAIMDYEVPNFSKEIQEKVASILRLFDRKIETNININQNLEKQMQAIFTDWYNTASKGADTVTLESVCQKVTDGSHFSPQNNPSSTIPMLSVKDMRKYDFDLTSCKHISEDDYQIMVSNDCVPQIDDILVAKDGSYLKEIFICNEHRKQAVLSSIAIFRPNRAIIYPEILLAFLKSPKVLQEVRDNYVSGSALPRIVLKDFKKLNLNLPSLKQQESIIDILNYFRYSIATNIAENLKLINLRDTLLPMLMSGELDVSSINI